MKRIETAASMELDLSTGRKVALQEFTAFHAVKVVGKFRKILKTLRDRNILDLSQLQNADGGWNLEKAIDWADVILEIAESNYDDLIGIIIQATVEDENFKALKKDETEGFSIADIFNLTKAVYTVNVEKGSLKTVVETFVQKKEEEPENSTETSNEESNSKEETENV